MKRREGKEKKEGKEKREVVELRVSEEKEEEK